MSLAGGTQPGLGPLYGPRAAITSALHHHTMAYDTLGYRQSFPYPALATPTTGLGGLGCGEWYCDDRLGDCPSGPVVVVNSAMPEWFNYKLEVGADQPIDIPGWLFWIAGAFAVLHLLKGRR